MHSLPSPHSSGLQQSLALAVSSCRAWIAHPHHAAHRAAGSLADTNAHTDKEARSTRTTPPPEHVRLCSQTLHDASRYRAQATHRLAADKQRRPHPAPNMMKDCHQRRSTAPTDRLANDHRQRTGLTTADCPRMRPLRYATLLERVTLDAADYSP